MYSTQDILYIYSFPTRPYFSQKCLILKVYFASILFQPVLISLRDVFFSTYTLHLFLSNPSLFLSQRCILLKVYFTSTVIQPVRILLSEMYYSQGILYIYCYPTIYFSSLRCILPKIYFTTIYPTRPYFFLRDVVFLRYTLYLLLSNPSLFLSTIVLLYTSLSISILFTLRLSVCEQCLFTVVHTAVHFSYKQCIMIPGLSFLS